MSAAPRQAEQDPAGASAELQTLASYVPLQYIRLLALPEPPAAPIRLGLRAAVLLADISGFTALTERLGREGEVGAELLAATLNAYFGQLIDRIDACGGEVVKFAGDGLIALWRAPAAGDGLADDGGADAVAQAAGCALSLQAALAGARPVHGVTLSMRIGIGLGDVVLRQLGGRDGRWEFVCTGAGLQQASLVCPLAQPGQVALAAPAWERIAAHGHAEPVDGGVRLVQLVAPPVAPSAKVALHPAMVAPLRACLPDAVLDRLDAGQGGWLGELRRVTVLFALLPDLDDRSTAADGAAERVAELQAIIGQHEGSINKLHVDEKGVMLLAVFGLPPLSHPDDALRGVRAAVACQPVLQRASGRCAIGVATGHAFCGTIGNEQRREYTVLGDVVNLAARLMSAAASSALPILCDAPSYEAARAGVRFGGSRALKVKGKAEPITAHVPLAAAGPVAPPSPEHFVDRMIGRHGELERIVERLRALSEQAAGGCILIEGEAGIGKSRLVAEVLAHAERLGITSLCGTGDAIEHATAYFAWTGVFRALFQLPAPLTASGAPSDAQGPNQSVRQSLREQLEQLAPEYADQLALLGPVLRLELDAPDGEWTRAVASRAHAEQRQALLARTLARARGPLLLLLENAHWLDSASWALLHRVRREVPGLLLVVTSRPPAAIADAATLAEYQRLRADPQALLLLLQPLPRADVVALLRDRMGGAEPPPPLVDFLFEQTAGHPFFTEELAAALHDAGAFRVEAGVCHLKRTLEQLRALRLPTTMHGVVLSRIDRLRPPQHLLLKVASVVGRTFVHPLLSSVHPIASDRPHLRVYLDDLERHDLTSRLAADELTYSFKHIIIQEVAYNTLAFAQRRQLHLEVAAWYERSADGVASHRAAELYPLLAHHYSQAADHPHASREELDKAVDALQRAGTQALHSGASREAIALLERGLALLARLPESATRARRELALRAPLAIALSAVRGFVAPETEQALLRSLLLCEHVERDGGAGRPPELLPTLFGLWTFNITRGRIWLARDYALRLEREGQGDPDSDAALAATAALHITCFFLGELTAARAHAESLLRRYRRERHQRLAYLYGIDLEVMCGGYLGHCLWYLGQAAEARPVYERAVACARELSHPYSLTFAMFAAGIFAQGLQDVPAVREVSQALQRIAAQQGYPHVALQAEFLGGWVQAKEGQAPAGIARMQAVMSTRRRVGSELSLTMLLAIIAQLELDSGQPDAALATITDAVQRMNANGERFAAAEVLRVQAEILRRKSRGAFLEYPLDGAPEDLFLRALDIARCQQARLFELRAATSLCQLWRAEGNREEAACLLEQTLVRCSGLADSHDGRAAHALRTELLR